MSTIKPLVEKGHNRWFVLYFSYKLNLNEKMISNGYGNMPWSEIDKYPSHAEIKSHIQKTILDAHEYANVCDCVITSIQELSLKDIKGFCDE